jgi:hypothetical protein
VAQQHQIHIKGVCGPSNMNDDGSYHGLSLSMMLSNNNIRCPKSAQKRLYKGSLGWCGRIVLCIPTALLAYMLYPATSRWPTSVPPFTRAAWGGLHVRSYHTDAHPPTCVWTLSPRASLLCTHCWRSLGRPSRGSWPCTSTQPKHVAVLGRTRADLLTSSRNPACLMMLMVLTSFPHQTKDTSC